VKRTTRIAPVAVLVAASLGLSGCFATQQDIRVLQGDISLLRTEQASADSARRVQLDRVIRDLRTANDSLHSLSSNFLRFRGDVSTSLSSVDQQLLQIQELTGQSQQRLQEVRASLEAREQAPAPAAPGAPAGATDQTPGPNQLFQLAREQMMQGSNASARQGFQDLLDKYPKSDLAADAQFYIAETYAAENNTAAADSVYARVASKYAGSARAATAIYKRAVAAQNAGRTDAARDLFNQVVKKYPRSDEAALARDRLRSLK
jgi:tol-pal system protein YbgF